jgi:hypothetical protein
VVPVVIPSPIEAFPNPLKEVPKQQGTDYAYIQQLCGETGNIFYLDPGPRPGMSVAYWGPDLTKMFGGTQRALSINLDASSNVDSLSFAYDGTVAKQLVVMIEPEETKFPIPIPVPSLDLLTGPLSAHEPTILKVEQLPLARKEPAEAALAILSALRASSDVVTASGQLDVLRYGQVFKARKLCAVRGASAYYDGLYYVKSVTHDLKRGEYKQSFTLARRGTGSTVAAVAV